MKSKEEQWVFGQSSWPKTTLVHPLLDSIIGTNNSDSLRELLKRLAEIISQSGREESLDFNRKLYQGILYGSLDLAIMYDHLECLTELIAACTQVEDIAKPGGVLSRCHGWAVAIGSSKCTQKLLDLGASANSCPDSFLFTAPNERQLRLLNFKLFKMVEDV